MSNYNFTIELSKEDIKALKRVTDILELYDRLDSPHGGHRLWSSEYIKSEILQLENKHFIKSEG